MTLDARKLAAWKPLLDACDHLTAVAHERGANEKGAEAQITARRQEAALEAERFEPSGAQLGEEAGELHGLADPQDRLLLGLLVQNHLSGKSPSLRARELVALVADSSYERLAWLTRLQDGGALSASGLVMADPVEEGAADPLEVVYRLSKRGVERLLCGNPPPAGEPARAIEDEGDLLSKIRELAGLYERRAELLFEREDKPGATPDRPESREDEQIEALESVLGDAFDGSVEVPFRSALIQAVRQFRLSFEEAFLVGYLLLEELIDGEPWQQGVHVLRLMADSEAALWNLRTLLEADSALRRNDLIVLEELIDGRPLSSEIALSTWLVQRLTAGSESSIQPDERIDFHLYLKDLGDSESFFRRLDSDKGGEAE